MDEVKGMDVQVSSALKGRKTLVTGGTGFIGGRLVEKLVLEYDADVRVLVRDFSTASRIARFPIEMVGGDIADEAAVDQAVQDCDIVFHCAHDFSGTPRRQKRLATASAEYIAQAVLRHEVGRLVHVSTVSVYGDTEDGDLDETASKRPRHAYGRAKLAAEQIILDYCRSKDLPASVLQPTIVYGPYSKPWTLGPVEQLLSGQVVLVDGGTGYCNAVYVDDVVSAMILASIQEAAIGEVFLISSDQPITWRDFYGAYEDIIGINATTSLRVDELRGLALKISFAQVKRLVRNPQLWKGLYAYDIPAIRSMYGSVERITPFDFKSWFTSKVIHRPDPLAGGDNPEPVKLHIPTQEEIKLRAAKTRVRIDKARRCLGYEPLYDFSRGMEMTGQFVRWYYSLQEV